MAWFKSREDKLKAKLEVIKAKEKARKDQADKEKELGKLKQQIERSDKYEEQLAAKPAGSKSFSHVENAGKIAQIKDRLWPERSYIINMELRNGMHDTFLISTKKNYFKYMGGTYVIDPQLQHFHVASRTYALDYHQDIPLPIKREIPVKDIQKTIKELGRIDPDQLTTAMNPLSLEAFIEGRVIEQLMKAQDIEAFFKNMRIIFIANLILSALTFFVLVKSTGMLDNLKLPF